MKKQNQKKRRKRQRKKRKSDFLVDKQQEAQQKMMQFQLMQNQLETLRAQLQNLAGRAEELSVARLTLENLNISKSAEAFIPVGSGNFVRGKIEDSKNVLVSIGGNAAVKKTKEEAIKVLDEKLSVLQDEGNNLGRAEQHVLMELSRLQAEIQRLANER